MMVLHGLLRLGVITPEQLGPGYVQLSSMLVKEAVQPESEKKDTGST
jgi:hypothetical protein